MQTKRRRDGQILKTQSDDKLLTKNISCQIYHCSVSTVELAYLGERIHPQTLSSGGAREGLALDPNSSVKTCPPVLNAATNLLLVLRRNWNQEIPTMATWGHTNVPVSNLNNTSPSGKIG